MPNVPLKKLNHKHLLMCTFLAQGKTLDECCERVSVSRGYWQGVQHDPLVKAEIDRNSEELRDRVTDDYVQDPVRARLKQLAPEAVETIKTEMKNADGMPRYRLQVSEMILEKAGYVKPPETVQETRILNLNMNEELLAEILSRGPPGPKPKKVSG